MDLQASLIYLHEGLLLMRDVRSHQIFAYYLMFHSTPKKVSSFVLLGQIVNSTQRDESAIKR